MSPLSFFVEHNYFKKPTLKHTTGIAILTLAILGLLAGRNVLAKPADAAALGKPEPASEGPRKCDRREGKEKRLETLKSDLKLNVNQEAAWTEWAGKIKGDHTGWEEKRKNVESWASLPAPDRMEKMLAFSKEHIARQEARIAATKTFYATLSPEQRQTFDKDFNFEHHGRFGMPSKK
jgi:protein CpxP